MIMTDKESGLGIHAQPHCLNESLRALLNADTDSSDGRKVAAFEVVRGSFIDETDADGNPVFQCPNRICDQEHTLSLTDRSIVGSYGVSLCGRRPSDG